MCANIAHKFGLRNTCPHQVVKNKIPFEIFTPAKIVKSLLTVAIATIKAYCDKYTYILVNHTKQDQFFLSTLRLRYTWHLSTFIHTEKWKEIVILEK